MVARFAAGALTELAQCDRREERRGARAAHSFAKKKTAPELGPLSLVAIKARPEVFLERQGGDQVSIDDAEGSVLDVACAGPDQANEPSNA